ncbi:uncharacterized protein [Antedon mediterranea]|uniref:uncharacterized protein n=1 Tax=Antedon mediterranea TaxID=105859 RepID=UPI003AF4BDDC
MEPSCTTKYILIFFSIFYLRLVTAIRVYDVRADSTLIGSQTAVISWTTDNTTDSLNNTIRGFRIDANYLLSRRGNEILLPTITNTTLERLRSGVTYRACVIVLTTNTFGNGEITDNTACVSFTTDFVAINSYSLTAIGIGVAIIILFLVTQLINLVCPREGSEGFSVPPTEREVEKGGKDSRRKKSHRKQPEKRKAGHVNATHGGKKQNRKKNPKQTSDSKGKRKRENPREISRRTDLDGSKGGGGKHKSVKA